VGEQDAASNKGSTKSQKGIVCGGTNPKPQTRNALEFICVPSDPLTEAEADWLANLFAEAIVRQLKKTGKI
jgi:hypothetical protein